MAAAPAVTHPQQLLVLLLQLAFQVPHPLLDAPVALLRLRTDHSIDGTGGGGWWGGRESADDRFQPQTGQKQTSGGDHTSQSLDPKLKDGGLIARKHVCGQSWSEQRVRKRRRKRRRDGEGGHQKDRMREEESSSSAAKCELQPAEPCSRPHQFQQPEQSPTKTPRGEMDGGLLSTGRRGGEEGAVAAAPRDYLPKNGAHVLDFSFHNKVIIIRGGRGAGVRLCGRGRGEGHGEKVTA